MKYLYTRKLSKYKKALLTTAVIVGLMTNLSFVMAEDEPYLDVIDLNSGSDPMAELIFLRQDYGIGVGDSDPLVYQATYDLDKSLRDATSVGASYWTDMLWPGAQNKQRWQIFITTFDKQNASADSQSVVSNGETFDFKKGSFYVNELLQEGINLSQLTYENSKSGAPPAGSYGYSEILIGRNMGANRDNTVDGWWVDGDTVLPTNEQATDYVGTIRHEIGHALGIICTLDTKGYGANKKYYFSNGLADNNSWSLQLQDQNGNYAKAGMEIITTEQFENLNTDNSEDPDDYFIVDNIDLIAEDGKGFAYFSGPNVREVLDGATFFGRNALPVNGWEDGAFEGQHIQLSGMMSHRDYSNFTSFLETELAVMQDIGYNIDRRAYYGRSIYGNGNNIINNQGYFARNTAGTAYLTNTFSQVPLGIGLHIYGSNNTVTQAANILTRGDGATGVRVDGVGNTLIIPSDTEIHADGFRGNGILVAYGSGQNVEQAGTVTASGEGGTGIRFDFGSSSNGAIDEYRGSYIRYKRSVGSYDSAYPGEILTAKNLDLIIDDADTYNSNKNELNGAMVENFNLSGTLVGKENAIYISKNAFVKNININAGANIQGDITSKWKQFNDPSCEDSYDNNTDSRQMLRIQYNGKFKESGYDYHFYIPDLVTNLNFNTTLNYNGNITGTDNMKINVNKGTLTYSGHANVLSVNVAKEANLYGGSYEVNDVSTFLAEDFTDQTTGKFYNHGSIGASSETTNMCIEGSLVSDGVLRGYGGGTNGQIIVEGEGKGSANVEGSIASATNALPNEEFTILQANAIYGSLGNTTTPYAATGMLNTTGTVIGNEIKVQTTAANNLGPADTIQQTTYDAMTDMQLHLSANEDNRINEMRGLYSLNPSEARKALTAIASSPAPNNMVKVQSNTMTSHLLSARLSEAFASKEINLAIPTSKLDKEKDEKALTMDLKLAQPVDNDFWFKTARDWGEGNSSYYQGTTLAGGCDRAYGRSWRAGAFISYGSFSFADDFSHNGVKDTRMGIYGGYSNGPHSGYIYLDHGWINNDLTRRLTGLGLQAKANYNSRILELSGEYRYDLNAKNMKIWHVSPYAKIQLSQLWQDGYTEQGAGIFGHKVGSQSNSYFAGGLGLEFKRHLTNGNYAFRLGIKHAFKGTDPKFTYSYIGNDTKCYELQGQQDKTHFIMSLGGEAEFAPGWTLAGDLALQKSGHDKDIMAAVTLRRMW